MVTVVCIKQGDKYGSNYVNILHASLKRNSTVPFRFVCLTDDPYGVELPAEARPLPVKGLSGWWNKIPLFSDFTKFGGDVEQIIAIDLDVAITGNVDWLLEWRGDFLGVRDPIVESKFNGSLYSFKPGACSEVWDTFYPRAQEIMSSFYSDQEWISSILFGKPPTIQTLFPGEVKSFRMDWLNKAPEERDPSGSIWLFHGLPKPPDVLYSTPWVKEAWRVGA